MAGGTRSYEIAKRMVDAGHEVHMISSWREPSSQDGWRIEDIDGITVHWLPVPYKNAMSFRERVRAFLKFAMSAGKRAAAVGGDIIFATSTPLTVALPAVYASRKLRLPIVFEVRDLWPELPIAIGAIKNPILKMASRWLEKFAYRNSSNIIALSPGMAEGVIATGYPESRVEVIPNGCDNDLFNPNRERAKAFREQHRELGDGPIVLYAGTFGKINGVSFLPELAARLAKRHPSVRFVSIGDGAETQLVRDRAKELGAHGVNYFQYPSKPKELLIDAFQAATVSISLFVDLPEMWNNSANKFFDTLASGTAVAINYHGWQRDLIEEDDIGIVLGPNIDEAATRLGDFLDDMDGIKAKAERARQTAMKKFDRDLLASKLISVVEAAAQRGIETSKPKLR